MSATSAATSAPRRRSGLIGLLLKDPAAVAAMICLGIIFAAALFAPWIAPYDPLKIDMAKILQPPQAGHWFGTDGQGRDILSRIFFGIRITLMLGFAAIITGGALGTAIGLIAAFYRKIDSPLMRIMDMMLSFPAILFGLAIAAIVGPGTTSVIIALSVATLPLTARIARGAALVVLANDYIGSGRAIGLNDLQLLWRYALPNCISTVLVFLTLRLGQAILLGASLSFLGLGTQPPQPELGTMAAQGVSFIFFAPHVTIIPSLVIFVLVLAMNVMGDALRDALDPRLNS
jgi:ABC-type dipeptide/oligopeptide/nickel transport system permease subunit